MKTTISVEQANQFINDLQEYLNSCREPIAHLCVDFPFYDRIRKNVESKNFLTLYFFHTTYYRWKKAGYPNTAEWFHDIATLECNMFYPVNSYIYILLAYSKNTLEELDIDYYIGYLEIVAEIKPIIKKLKAGVFCGQPLLLSGKEAGIIYTYLN